VILLAAPRGSERSINMPVTSGKDFQAAVIYRPDALENR
jgi:hypothetical protein